MNTLLKDIWYGQAYPLEAPPIFLAKLRELEHASSGHKEILSENLSPQYKDAFEKYDDCQAELLSLSEVEAFIKGIRFATRFFMEATEEN